MTGFDEFSETGFGGVYYGPWNIQKGFRRAFREAGVDYSDSLAQNIDTVVRSCTTDITQQIESEGRELSVDDPLLQECTQWINDVLVDHLSFDEIQRFSGVNPVMPPIDIDVINILLNPEQRKVVKDAAELAWEQQGARQLLWEIGGGALWYMTEEHFSGNWFLHQDYVPYFNKDSTAFQQTIGPLAANATYAWKLLKFFTDLQLVGADMWDHINHRRSNRGETIREALESYTAPREWEGYEEGSMPYNRRTGQWYPARRYSRSTPYRRYNRYGNRGGWSPRRRRTYRRW